MTCDQAEEQLLESFDEPLAVDARRALDRHLVLPGCAAFAGATPRRGRAARRGPAAGDRSRVDRGGRPGSSAA